MLTMMLGTDWVANRDTLLSMIVQDVKEEKGGRIWMVPELISHDTERRLCKAAGDTASRFAEVLSFTRLYRRVCETVGHGTRECLDNGGRLVAMAAAARQLHSKLKAYASVETRPEFLMGLVDAVDEFKRCCITAEDLRFASRQTQGSLAQKLEELALLLETYDALCQQGKRDPSDQMTWLLEQLEDSSFAVEHVFYIEGFPDFTRQHMEILKHLAQQSPNVVISLNCDSPSTADLAFETAANTAALLLRWAEDAGVKTRVCNVKPRNDALEPVRRKLFHGVPQHHPHTSQKLQVCRFNSVYEECLGAAERIMTLVRSGARYRDISVVCGDMGAYRNTVSMVLQRCNIPIYLSGTEDILEKTVITTVLAAIDAALGGFERTDVIRYLKSMLSPLELATCDLVENYAIMWNITGSRWLQTWTNHPEGLGEEWTDRAQGKLSALNAAREQLVDPLVRLRNGFRSAVSVSQQVTALYEFLNDIRLSDRLAVLADEMDLAGDNRNAQILDQLWEILLSALEQMHDVLGQTHWDEEHFTRLLRLLLSQYDVGTIPPVLDSVMVGPVSAMRCLQVKHVIVLGALEGSLPGYPGSKGVLTDQDRVALRQIGVPLTGGAMDGIQAEFAEIYGVFCGAEESIYVSCPAGQPSFLYRRLLTMAGEESQHDELLGAAKADPLEAGALFVRVNDKNAAAAVGVTEAYERVHSHVSHNLGTISQENIRKIYGKELKLSASQVDRFADCRFSYFLKYGMRAKERKTITVDPAEFGSYVHAVLEKTAKAVMDRGGFAEVSLEQTMDLAREFAAQYADERFSQIDSERITYLFQRNTAELELVVEELWEELRESGFVPVEFELSFGGKGIMDPIEIPGRMMAATLRGFVDRVDAWKQNGQNYFRVVDYKTGRKDFDYCDVFIGYGLQLLIYLYALENAGELVLGEHPVPAGVQYFPARVPFISAEGLISDEEADALREKAWKRKGLLLNDEQILEAMEPGEKPRRLNITRKKDGTISGDIADRSQFRLLKGYVFTLLGKMVDEIASGSVEANPYTRGSSHNACTFCPYGAVCHPDEVSGRRDYKTMSSQKFWEEVEKEMSKHG